MIITLQTKLDKNTLVSKAQSKLNKIILCLVIF